MAITIPIWDSVADAVSGVYLWLLNLPIVMIKTIMDLAYLILYPFIVGLNYLSDDIGYVYNAAVAVINVMILISNLGMTLLNTMFSAAMPSIWVVLILGMIGVNGIVRAYSMIRHIKTWIPTWGN